MKNKWEEFIYKHTIIAIVLIVVIAIIFAVILTCMVHSEKILSKIPGTDAEWFAFWPSYLGGLVSVVIALLTWKNQRALDLIKEQQDGIKEAAIKSIIGVNLRLKDIVIRPEGYLNQNETAKYRVTFVFDNMSNTLLDNMQLVKMHLNGTEVDTEDLDFEYKLRHNTPILEGILILETNSELETQITNFYFYYSQYAEGCNFLNMQIDVKIAINSNEVKTIQVIISLEILPQFDVDTYSNKIRINDYKIQYKDKIDI